MHNWRFIVKMAVSVCSFIYRKDWECKWSVNGVCGWCCGCNVCNGRRNVLHFSTGCSLRTESNNQFHRSSSVFFTNLLLRFFHGGHCICSLFMVCIIILISIPLHVKCFCVSLVEWNYSILIENFVRLKKKQQNKQQQYKKSKYKLGVLLYWRKLQCHVRKHTSNFKTLHISVQSTALQLVM